MVRLANGVPMPPFNYLVMNNNPNRDWQIVMITSLVIIVALFSSATGYYLWRPANQPAVPTDNLNATSTSDTLLFSRMIEVIDARATNFVDPSL